MQSRSHDWEAGFSLVELMVVIVIIGILATAATLTFMSAPEKAKQTMAVHDIIEVEKAINLFKLDKGRLPEDLEEIKDRFTDGVVPTDPWGNDYIYRKISKRKFDLICYGADGEEGGEDFDMDLNIKKAKNLQKAKKEK